MPEHNDSLTGLPDRVALEHALKPLIEKAEGVALAALDIDYVMSINAEFGTETGDRVLRALAGLLAESESGQAYRITGDEFMVVMPGLNLEEAFLQMERLRKQIEGAAERFGLPGQRAVTVTIGVAQHPRDAKDALGLREAAA